MAQDEYSGVPYFRYPELRLSVLPSRQLFTHLSKRHFSAPRFGPVQPHGTMEKGEPDKQSFRRWWLVAFPSTQTMGIPTANPAELTIAVFGRRLAATHTVFYVGQPNSSPSARSTFRHKGIQANEQISITSGRINVSIESFRWRHGSELMFFNALK